MSHAIAIPTLPCPPGSPLRLSLGGSLALRLEPVPGSSSGSCVQGQNLQSLLHCLGTSEYHHARSPSHTPFFFPLKICPPSLLPQPCECGLGQGETPLSPTIPDVQGTSESLSPTPCLMLQSSRAPPPEAAPA